MLKQMTLVQKFEKATSLLSEKSVWLICACVFFTSASFAASASPAGSKLVQTPSSTRSFHLLSYAEFSHLNRAQRVIYIQGMRYAMQDAAMSDDSSSESKPKEASVRIQEIFDSNISLFPQAYAADSSTSPRTCFIAGWMGTYVNGVCGNLPAGATQTPNYITCNPLLFGSGDQMSSVQAGGGKNRNFIERYCASHASGDVKQIANDIITKKQSALWNSTWQDVQDKCSSTHVTGCSRIRARVLQIDTIIHASPNLDPSFKRSTDAATATGTSPTTRSIVPPVNPVKTPATPPSSVPPAAPAGSKKIRTHRTDGDDPVDTAANDWSTAPADASDGATSGAPAGSNSTSGSDSFRGSARRGRGSRRRAGASPSGDSATDSSQGSSSRFSADRASSGGPPNYDDSFVAQPGEGKPDEILGTTEGRQAANDELGGRGFRTQCQPNLLLSDLSIPCDTDSSGHQIHPEICDSAGSLESDAVLTPQDAYALYCTDPPKIDEALLKSRRQAMAQTLANISFLAQNDASYYKPLIQGFQKNFEICVAEAKRRKDSGIGLPTNILPAEYQSKIPVVVRGTMIDVGKGSNVETTNIAYIGQALKLQHGKLCDLMISGNASGYSQVPDSGGLNQGDAPVVHKRKHKSTGAQ